MRAFGRGMGGGIREDEAVRVKMLRGEQEEERQGHGVGELCMDLEAALASPLIMGSELCLAGEEEVMLATEEDMRERAGRDPNLFGLDLQPSPVSAATADAGGEGQHDAEEEEMLLLSVMDFASPPVMPDAKEDGEGDVDGLFPDGILEQEQDEGEHEGDGDDELARWDANTNMFHCAQCPKAFRYQSRFKRHLSAHGRKRHPCQLCHKLFSRQDVLQVHLAKVHHHQQEQQQAQPAAPAFPCPKCGQVLRSQANLDRHVKLAHDADQQGSRVCPSCGRSFARRRSLLRHLRCSPSCLGLGDGVAAHGFPCSLCGRRFAQRALLERHARVHSGEAPFHCKHCGRRFKQMVNLRQHQQRVHGDDGGDGDDVERRKRFSCDQCPKRFRSRAELRNHAVYHSGVRAHSCSACQSAFYERRHLHRHIRRVHARIKNFFCADCGKTFYERYELNFHRRRAKNCGKSNDATDEVNIVGIEAGSAKEDGQNQTVMANLFMS